MSHIKYDPTYLSTMLVGYQNFGVGELQQDVIYPLFTVYKSTVIESITITTVGDLASGVLEVYLINSMSLDKGVVHSDAFTTFYADKALTTAVTDTKLTFNAVFNTKKSPDKYVLEDSLNSLATPPVIDWNCLNVALKIKGASPATIALYLNIKLTHHGA